MRSLTELPENELQVALAAADTLMRHKEFLPRGGLLLMLTSRLRDDARDTLGMETERAPGRGQVFRSPDEMTTTELNAVSAAVATLLDDRLTANMDDPALPQLLREFDGELTKQKTEREQLRAQVAL
jgi:hypothetical protein